MRHDENLQDILRGNSPKKRIWAAPLIAACLSGCSTGHVLLNANDAVMMSGQDTVFETSVARKYSLALNEDVRGVTVQFTVDGKPIGSSTTDKSGRAILRSAISSSKRSYFEAHSIIEGQHLTARGRVFHWDRRRTIVAVDVDDTICRTDYLNLFITESEQSAPIKDAPEVLRALSNDYSILYVSARPRFLHHKTCEWLDKNGFPPGPYADALSGEACLKQAHYKQEILKEWQQRFPNILIGIGDKQADDVALGAARMLAFIYDGKPFRTYRPHCVVCRDWQKIGWFLSSYHKRLSDPAALATLIDRSDMNLRPLFAQPARIDIADGPVTSYELPTSSDAILAALER